MLSRKTGIWVRLKDVQELKAGMMVRLEERNGAQIMLSYDCFPLHHVLH